MLPAKNEFNIEVTTVIKFQSCGMADADEASTADADGISIGKVCLLPVRGRKFLQSFKKYICINGEVMQHHSCNYPDPRYIL